MGWYSPVSLFCSQWIQLDALGDELTQVEVAEKLGCPQSWISQMESGVRTIGQKMANRLAKVFRTDTRVFRS